MLIHGAATGADSIAANIAEHELGWEVRPYPADWKFHGKAAGPIRNQQMLDDNPDIELVLAFHDNLAKSKGTRDMVNRAVLANKPVQITYSRTTS